MRTRAVNAVDISIGFVFDVTAVPRRIQRDLP